MNYSDFKSFHELKDMKKKDLYNFCQEIRNHIIDISKSKKIHLNSNLGIVELNIALALCFDLDKDILFFDTGHQCYVHKILTGRKNKLHTIRDFGGISGFISPEESKYDFYSSGHSSNSISICQGYIENSKEKKWVVPIIGDAAISNGLAFEALNDVSYKKTKMIIIINDNEMSISKNVGSLYKNMSKMKNTSFFFFFERLARFLLTKTKFTTKIYNLLFKFYNNFEKIIFGKNFFENLDYLYVGPIDGHNIKKISLAIKKAKWYSQHGPVILHVKTIKGKGLEIRDCKNEKYHSYSHLDNNKIENNYTKIAVDFLKDKINKNNDIHIINSAMTYSLGYSEIESLYPNNYEDVGINEEHSISKAAGVSLSGKKVFIPMYSTFLQRGYDQILHDIARLKLPVIFLIDRADLAIGDGDTHHGIYDLGMLISIPNVIITSPSNKKEMLELLEFSYKNKSKPFFIRFSNNKISEIENGVTNYGKWKIALKSKKVTKKAIVSYGHYINILINDLNEYNVDIINAIFLTDYDEEYVISILSNYDEILFYERIYDQFGIIAKNILFLLNQNNLHIRIHSMTFKDSKIGFGDEKKLNEITNMNHNKIIEKLKLIKY